MKVLITISGDHISSRLDMTQEVLIAKCRQGEITAEPKTILLGKTSAEDLCNFILQENISCVVCGGIEEKHYKYLLWKKTRVIDSVIGPHHEALQLLLQERLNAGAILSGAKKQQGKDDRTE